MIGAIDQTLEEFGRSLGMEGLALRNGESLVLNIDRIGTVAFEVVGVNRDVISISISNRIEPPDAEACRRILELCHPREKSPWPVHAGIDYQGALVFAMGMDFSDFILPNIHRALDWLDGLHQQMSAVARAARMCGGLSGY